MDEIKELMIKYEKNKEVIKEHEEVIKEHENIIEGIEKNQDKISGEIENYFITYTFKDCKSYTILNTRVNTDLIKKLCEEKNVDYGCEIGTNYSFYDWDSSEYMKFVKKSNKLDKLLKYIENYIPESDDEDSDDE